MMKKILFLLAAASLTLTSCMKEDESYKQLVPVIPGMNIYGAATTQQRISMQPLDNVIRLGILLAEGELQQKTIDELPSMLASYGDRKVNVFNQLFRTKTTIAKTPEGNYTIEMKPETSGYYTSEGTLTVQTNGVDLLQNTTQENPWFVTLPSDFKVRVASNNSSTGYQEVLLEGAVSIYKDGSYYRLHIASMKAYMKESSSIYSNWSGDFELIPPSGGESLAFSTLVGKKFGFDGYASGPTCVVLGGTKGVEMSYTVTDGLYMNYMQSLGGSEKASLTGYSDYDTASFPARDVKIEWKLSADGTSLSQTISYNGYTLTR